MIEDWCDEECTLRPRVQVDERGEATFGKPVRGLCRFEQKTLIVGTAQGVQEQTDGIVYLASAAKWNLLDRLSYDGENFKILQVKAYKDGGVVQYQRFLVQRDLSE